MKTKTEIHIRPERVSVFEGVEQNQVVNVLREHCSSDYLPGVAVALAKGYAAGGAAITLRTFDAHGVELSAKTFKREPARVAAAKRATKKK